MSGMSRFLERNGYNETIRTFLAAAETCPLVCICAETERVRWYLGGTPAGFLPRDDCRVKTLPLSREVRYSDTFGTAGLSDNHDHCRHSE